MADYKESNVSGSMTQWQRCRQITIQNPYNDIPNVRFEEEVIKVLPDGTQIKENAGLGILKEFDPSLVIQIRNPATWELTEQTVTMGEIMAMVGSVYWHFAMERDNG